VKVLRTLYQTSANRLENRYDCHGSPCEDCGTHTRPILITPTQRKNYGNPHIGRVWYEAERALRAASRAVIIGYSLPDDDLDVLYVLKRGLAHLDPGQITVVEYDQPARRCLSDHPVGRRYRALFGESVQWCPDGFAGWVATAAATSSQVTK